MYQVSAYQVPEGYAFSEYTVILLKRIKEDDNAEDAKDKLFRMSYPIMLNELKKYLNLAPMDDLCSYLALAFMRTIDKFDPYQEGGSFINYYKLTLRTEVINHYYGKYRHSEELRALKRKFEGTMHSLDYSLTDKNDVETNDWYDMIQDTTVNIEEEILKKDLKQTSHIIIDGIFDEPHKGRHSDKPKKIFTEYIDSILDDTGMKNVDIAKKHNVVKSTITNALRRYVPIFKEDYKNIL